MNNLADDLQYLVNTGRITEYDILLEINNIRKCNDYSLYISEPIEININVFCNQRQNQFWLLSKDAQKAVDYILDLLDPVSIKNRIDIILRKKFNWSKHQTSKVIKEIKEYLRDADAGVF